MLFTRSCCSLLLVLGLVFPPLGVGASKERPILSVSGDESRSLSAALGYCESAAFRPDQLTGHELAYLKDFFLQAWRDSNGHTAERIDNALIRLGDGERLADLVTEFNRTAWEEPDGEATRFAQRLANLYTPELLPLIAEKFAGERVVLEVDERFGADVAAAFGVLSFFAQLHAVPQDLRAWSGRALNRNATYPPPDEGTAARWLRAARALWEANEGPVAKLLWDELTVPDVHYERLLTISDGRVNLPLFFEDDDFRPWKLTEHERQMLQEEIRRQYRELTGESADENADHLAWRDVRLAEAGDHQAIERLVEQYRQAMKANSEQSGDAQFWSVELTKVRQPDLLPLIVTDLSIQEHDVPTWFRRDQMAGMIVLSVVARCGQFSEEVRQWAREVSGNQREVYGFEPTKQANRWTEEARRFWEWNGAAIKTGDYAAVAIPKEVLELELPTRPRGPWSAQHLLRAKPVAAWTDDPKERARVRYHIERLFGGDRFREQEVASWLAELGDEEALKRFVGPYVREKSGSVALRRIAPLWRLRQPLAIALLSENLYLMAKATPGRFSCFEIVDPHMAAAIAILGIVQESVQFPDEVREWAKEAIMIQHLEMLHMSPPLASVWLDSARGFWEQNQEALKRHAFNEVKVPHVETAHYLEPNDGNLIQRVFGSSRFEPWGLSDEERERVIALLYERNSWQPLERDARLAELSEPDAIERLVAGFRSAFTPRSSRTEELGPKDWTRTLAGSRQPRLIPLLVPGLTPTRAPMPRAIWLSEDKATALSILRIAQVSPHFPGEVRKWASEAIGTNRIWLHEAPPEADDWPRLAVAFWRANGRTIREERFSDAVVPPDWPDPATLPSRQTETAGKLPLFPSARAIDAAREVLSRHGLAAAAGTRPPHPHLENNVWRVEFRSPLFDPITPATNRFEVYLDETTFEELDLVKTTFVAATNGDRDETGLTESELTTKVLQRAMELRQQRLDTQTDAAIRLERQGRFLVVIFSRHLVRGHIRRQAQSEERYYFDARTGQLTLAQVRPQYEL